MDNSIENKINANKKLTVDFSLSEFVGDNLRARNDFSKKIEECLDYYNIDDKKYLRMNYKNLDSNINVQYETSELLKYMFANYNKNIFRDKRESKDNLTLKDITNYNDTVIRNIESLPPYLKESIKNKNTYMFNESLTRISNLITDRLSYLFFLIFDMDCKSTEKLLTELLVEIENFTENVSKKIKEDKVACQNNEFTNDNCIAITEGAINYDEISDIYYKVIVDDDNRQHNIDSCIGDIFESFSRNWRGVTRFMLTDDIYDNLYLSSHDMILFPTKKEKEVIESIYTNESTDTQVTRRKFKICLNNITTRTYTHIRENTELQKQHKINLYNLNLLEALYDGEKYKEYENDILDMIESDLFSKFYSILIDDQSYYTKTTISNKFLKNIDMESYYNKILDTVIDKDVLSIYFKEYKKHKEHLILTQEYERLNPIIKKLERTIKSCCKDIYNEMLLDVLPQLIEEKEEIKKKSSNYKKISNLIDLMLGQIYFETLKKENTKYIEKYGKIS